MHFFIDSQAIFRLFTLKSFLAKHDQHGASFQSLPIENKLHAQDNTHLYTVKVYYTQPVSLTIEDSSLSRPLIRSIHLFQSNQRVQAIQALHLSHYLARTHEKRVAFLESHH